MIISTFESVTRAWVQEQLDLPWAEAVKVFSYPWEAASKHDVPMFNLGEFKSPDDLTVEVGQTRKYLNGEWTGEYNYHPGTTRRCKNNLISISGIVLDVDKDYSILETIERLDKYEFVLYSTFNNLIPDPDTGIVREKFRVILPFSIKLLAQDISGFTESIKEQFPGVDHSSFTMSQSFYFHSGSERVVYHNTGIMIDPYTQFEYREPEVYVPKPHSNDTMTDDQYASYRKAVVASLRSCRGLGYRGTGSGGVLTLVSICKSIGLDFNEYDDICKSIAGADSDLQQSEIRLRAWTGWDGNRITATKRDRFIKDYGGVPVKIPHQNRNSSLVEMLEIRDRILADELTLIKNEIERRKTNG